jgi:hypothetical protein
MRQDKRDTKAAAYAGLARVLGDVLAQMLGRTLGDSIPSRSVSTSLRQSH